MLSILRGFGRNKFPILIIVATVFILAGMYFLNDIVLSIRMIELESFLREINREASQVDELGMVSKYKLHLDLYSNAIDEGKFDEEELKTVYLATSFEVQSNIPATKYESISEPVMWIINVFRAFLGKTPIRAAIENETDTELTLAYYFERNKHFRKALSIYEDALSAKKIVESKVAIVLLHEGYCRSLIGEYDKAKAIFVAIIRKYNNENIAITAALMLQYLETLQSEVNKVKQSGESDKIKSEKLYRLIAYEDALAVLEKIVPQNKKEADQIAYLNARCLEETGKTEESATVYQQIVQNGQDPDIAKMANSRLLIMGSADDEAKKLKDLAQKNNEVIGDKGFDRLLETSNRVEENREQLDPVNKKNIAEEIRKERVSGNTATGSAKSKNNIDKEKLDIFVDESMKEINNKIDNKKGSPTIAPKPTTPLVPTPKPTTRQLPTEAIARTQTAEPGVPYTQNYQDANGNIYKSAVYDANGNLEKTIVYEYDDKGNAVKIKVYDKNGNPEENY
jgi:tetratricopeptide (TPR) repeat protein